MTIYHTIIIVFPNLTSFLSVHKRMFMNKHLMELYLIAKYNMLSHIMFREEYYL